MLQLDPPRHQRRDRAQVLALAPRRRQRLHQARLAPRPRRRRAAAVRLGRARAALVRAEGLGDGGRRDGAQPAAVLPALHALHPVALVQQLREPEPRHPRRGRAACSAAAVAARAAAAVVVAVVQAVVRVGGVALGPRSHGRITVERALASEARGPVHERAEERAAQAGVKLPLGLWKGREQREARRVRERLGQVPAGGVLGLGRDQGHAEERRVRRGQLRKERVLRLGVGLEMLADDVPHEGHQQLLARLRPPAPRKVDLVVARGEVDQARGLAHDLRRRFAAGRQLRTVVNAWEAAALDLVRRRLREGLALQVGEEGAIARRRV